MTRKNEVNWVVWSGTCQDGLLWWTGYLQRQECMESWEQPEMVIPETSHAEVLTSGADEAEWK